MELSVKADERYKVGIGWCLRRLGVLVLEHRTFLSFRYVRICENARHVFRRNSTPPWQWYSASVDYRPCSQTVGQVIERSSVVIVNANAADSNTLHFATGQMSMTPAFTQHINEGFLRG
jgi:hypothetical protein